MKKTLDARGKSCIIGLSRKGTEYIFIISGSRREKPAAAFFFPDSTFIPDE